MSLPDQVHRFLRTASDESDEIPQSLNRQFHSIVFGGDTEWDGFIEEWAPKIHSFLIRALGPFGKEPLREIIPLPDGDHSAGATASFDTYTGQVRISPSTEDKPGQILEKLCHEFTHGSLNDFQPGDDVFYAEGFVDYSVWVLSHAPVWGEYRQAMVKAASYNIEVRRKRALMDLSDWDRKRWAGGLYASISRGPFVIASLRHRKLEGILTW